MKIAALSGKAACVRRSGFFQCFRSPIWIAFVRCSTNFRPPIPIPPLLTLALCFFDFIEFCFYSLWLFTFPLSPEKPVFYDGVQLFFTNPFPFPLALIYPKQQQQQLSTQFKPRLNLIRESAATTFMAFLFACACGGGGGGKFTYLQPFSGCLCQLSLVKIVTAFIPVATNVGTLLKASRPTRCQHLLQMRRERLGSYYVVSK